MRVDVIRMQSKWVNAQSAGSTAAMVERARQRGFDVHYPQDIYGSAMIAKARNNSLRAVRPDADFVLFIDDDMLPVEGALVRLVGHDVDVVSALCTTRNFPVRIAARHYKADTDTFSHLGKVPDNTLMAGSLAVGFGCVLVRKPVLDRVIEYVLSGGDWLESNRPMFDRLRVRAEYREEERARIEQARRKLWELEKYAPVFQIPMHRDQYEIAEDMHFSKLLHQLGVVIHLDTGCLVGHIGEFPYSAIQLGVSHPSEVIFDND
jgi:hypothetical protein